MPTANPVVTGTDFVFLPVTDFGASKSFYTEVLGLPFSVDYERIPGGEFETGGVTIVLIQGDAIGREVRPGGGALALHVDDVAEARERLEAAGVDFMGDIVDSGVCHQAYFADPDGHALILHHRYAPKN
jgi:catechol 2,3-dioxygenase-like lactoylglutathione lyase family enzyme